MADIRHQEKSIRVDVPVRTAYDQWTQFEEFPRFMDGIEKVEQRDPTHLHWIAKIAGQRVEWDAEIVDQEPDRKISWRSAGDVFNSGTVSFAPQGVDKTEVTLRMDFQPEGFLQKTGDALGFVERRVKGDLEKFKSFIEERQQPTGSWRGRIRGGVIQDSGESGAI